MRISGRIAREGKAGYTRYRLMEFIWHTFVATLPGIGSYFAAVALFFIAERFFPAERNQSLRDQFFNARYTLLVLILTPFVVLWPNVLAAKFASVTGGSRVTIDLQSWSASLTPSAWPIRSLVLPFIPMLVFDLFYYCHHRLQHEIPALWEQHKLHHMDETLSCLTNLRHHWLEDAIRVFTITIPMNFLIGLTPVQG